jgi:hypothetical protein
VKHRPSQDQRSDDIPAGLCNIIYVSYSYVSFPDRLKKYFFDNAIYQHYPIPIFQHFQTTTSLPSDSAKFASIYCG